MKKFVAFFMLCAACMLFTASGPVHLYAYENSSVYSAGGSRSSSPGGGGGGGEIGPWGEICKKVGQICAEWGICKLIDGIWSCVISPPHDGSDERDAAVCLCSNDEECYQKCSCGFESKGRGPVTFIKHTCRPPAN